MSMFKSLFGERIAAGAAHRLPRLPGRVSAAATSQLRTCLFALGTATLAFAATAHAADSPGLGKPIAPSDLKAWNVTILPDGTGLPPGSGTAAQGEKLFADKGCSLCHGEGGKGGRSNMLVGKPSLTEPGISADKTIANFWREPTTLFDYIRRAMPWPAPRTLSDDEVYALCAYLFAANKLIPEDEAMNAQTLPKVQMPNRDNFIIRFPDRI